MLLNTLQCMGQPPQENYLTPPIVLRLRRPAIEVFKVRISPDKPAGCQEGTHRSHFPGESDFPVIALACTTREQDSSLLFGHQMPMCTTHSSVLRRAERLG